MDSHQLFLRDDYKSIARYIKTKTKEEVKEYSEYFYQKAPNNEKLTDYLKDMRLGQILVQLRIKGEVKDRK